MLIEKEKEIRNSLNEEQYFKMCSKFIYHSNKGNKFIDILNVYFDTPNHDAETINIEYLKKMENIGVSVVDNEHQM